MGVLKENKHFLNFLVKRFKKFPIFINSSESPNSIYKDGENSVMLSLRGAKIELIEESKSVVAVGVPLSDIKFVKLSGDDFDTKDCKVMYLGSSEKILKSDTHLIFARLQYEKGQIINYYDKYKTLGSKKELVNLYDVAFIMAFPEVAHGSYPFKDILSVVIKNKLYA